MGEGKEEYEIDLPGYLIARYPVTAAQFKAFADDHAYHTKYMDNLKGILNHTVTLVTWHDAMTYCEWLTEKLKAWDKTPDPFIETSETWEWRGEEMAYHSVH